MSYFAVGFLEKASTRAYEEFVAVRCVLSGFNFGKVDMKKII